MSDRSPEDAKQFTALVLAADRGPDDPVARLRNVECKSLVPVDDVPMLVRVVVALKQSPRIGTIAIVIDDPALIEGLALIGPDIRAGRIKTLAAASSPSLSVLNGAEALGRPARLLVTTADHALLTPAMIDIFCTGCDRAAAQGRLDVAVGLAGRAVIRTAYPNAKRTYLKFRDDHYSGCNLFAFFGANGLKAAQLWRRVDGLRKRPWRVAALFGPRLLAGYLLGRWSLDEAFAAASARVGFSALAVKMPLAEAAIDVDTPADLELVERILRTARGS